MGNVHTFTSHVRPRFGLVSAALGSESSDVKETAEYVDMKNYDLVVFQGIASAVKSGSTVTLLIYQATSTAGAASVSMTHALATDTFLSTHATATDILTCQVRGEDLSSGYRYVGAQISTNDSTGTEKVGVVINQMRARYKQATLPS